jgi:hypothetical protein
MADKPGLVSKKLRWGPTHLAECHLLLLSPSELDFPICILLCLVCAGAPPVAPASSVPLQLCLLAAAPGLLSAWVLAPRLLGLSEGRD